MKNTSTTRDGPAAPRGQITGGSSVLPVQGRRSGQGRAPPAHAAPPDPRLHLPFLLREDHPSQPPAF